MENENLLLTSEEILQSLKDDYCDLHKSVHGVKARWIYSMPYNEQEMLVLLDQLQKEGERVWAAEAAREKEADDAFLAEINQFMELGAGDAKTALKWIHDAHDTGGNNEYLAFDLGCSWGFITKYAASLS